MVALGANLMAAGLVIAAHLVVTRQASLAERLITTLDLFFSMIGRCPNPLVNRSESPARIRSLAWICVDGVEAWFGEPDKPR
jgi:hypothetical protein